MKPIFKQYLNSKSLMILLRFVKYFLVWVICLMGFFKILKMEKFSKFKVTTFVFLLKPVTILDLIIRDDLDLIFSGNMYSILFLKWC